MRLAKNIEKIGTETAFKILAEAKKLEADGKKIIHLSVGQPDFKSPKHVVDAAKIGADVVTLPAGVLAKMLGHSLTDKGLKAFLADWEKLQSELSNKA